MPRIDEKQIGVAHVYARALLELAEKRGEADTIQDQLRELAGLVERNPAFATFVSSPLVDPEDRRQGLEDMFRDRLSDLLVDTLQVMNRKGRLLVLPTMAVLYHEDLEELRGRVEVRVFTAVELTEALRDQLRQTLAQATGHEVDLVEQVDPHMIGGLVVRIGDKKYDGSVRRQVHNLREVFHERAWQHIYESRLSEVEL